MPEHIHSKACLVMDRASPFCVVTVYIPKNTIYTPKYTTHTSLRFENMNQSPPRSVGQTPGLGKYRKSSGDPLTKDLGDWNHLPKAFLISS